MQEKEMNLWIASYKRAQKIKQDRFDDIRIYRIVNSDLHAALNAPAPVKKDQRFIESMQKAVIAALNHIANSDVSFQVIASNIMRAAVAAIRSACQQWIAKTHGDWRYGIMALIEPDLLDILVERYIKEKFPAEKKKARAKKPAKTKAKKKK